MTVIAISSIFLYGNENLNQVCILVEMGLLAFMGFLNGVFKDMGVIAVILLNIASLILTFVFHTGFGVIIIFLNLLMAFILFNNITITHRVYMLMHGTAAVLLTAVVYCTDISHTVFVNHNPVCTLFGTEIQSNMIGIFILGAALHWICLIEGMKWKKATRLTLVLLVMIPFGYRIFESKCRSAMFAGLFFIALYLIKIKPFEYRFYYIFVFGIIIASAVFCNIYMMSADWFSQFDTMGKNSFSRVGVWNEVFTAIRKYPWFGSGTDYKLGGLNSAHNTVLSILKALGLIPVISYAIMAVKRQAGQKNKGYTRTAQLAFMACLVVTFFESFFTESYTYIIFLLFLLNSEEEVQGDT